MNGTEMTHQQARKSLQAQADAPLQPRERAALETHLAHCPACQAYAAELNTTEKHLRQFFQTQRQRQTHSLNDPLPVIQTHLRHTMMQKRTYRLANAALIAALLTLVLVGILTFFPSEPQINPAVQPTLTEQSEAETIPTANTEPTEVSSVVQPTETHLSTTDDSPTQPASDDLYPLGLVPAQSDSLLVPPPTSPTADCETDSSSYTCQVEKAEARAEFDAKEFPYDPIGTHFDQIISTVNPREINFIFLGEEFTRITLKQGIGDYNPLDREGIPDEAFEDIWIGDLPGQYVHGSVIINEDQKKTWEPTMPIMRLFWQDGEHWFILGAVLPNTTVPPHPLLDNQEAFIGMATSLVEQRDSAQLGSVSEAKRVSGLGLVEPTLLPEGFYFSYARFDGTTNTVQLVYEIPGNAALIFIEQPAISPMTNESQGTTWIRDSHLLHSLSWETDSLYISMQFFAMDRFRGWLGDQRMQKIVDTASVLPSPNTPIRQYITKSGDTIWSIAEAFGVKPETILWSNDHLWGAGNALLYTGMILNIPPVDGVYYTIGNTSLQFIASEFDANVEDILYFPGNFIDPSNAILVPGNKLMIPNGRRSDTPWLIPTATRDNPTILRTYGPGTCDESYEGAIGFGIFSWPVDDPGATHIPAISGNDYWTAHLGLDLAAEMDAPVYATDSGVVVFSGWSDFGYGYVIILDHGNGYQSIYAHLNKVIARCGESVTAGQKIGEAGITGSTTGPHLHFEIHLDGEAINPWTVLPEP